MKRAQRGVCLVTGASSGIGRSCADRLAERGWTVVGASRTPPTEPRWQPVVMDVADESSVTAGVSELLAEHGRLDAVVTAAGFGLSGPVETTPLDQAREQLQTNFWGTVHVVREALPHMRGSGGGRIVLVGSLAGLVALPFQAYYSASKYALEGFGEALAYEVAPFGISVTLVEPGNTVTGFTDNRRRSDPDAASPYAVPNDRAVTTMERDERAGIPAEKVAAVVEGVLRARTPPRRAPVASPDERLGTFAKRLLPHRVFERLARGPLGL